MSFVHTFWVMFSPLKPQDKPTEDDKFSLMFLVGLWFAHKIAHKMLYMQVTGLRNLHLRHSCVGDYEPARLLHDPGPSLHYVVDIFQMGENGNF